MFQSVEDKSIFSLTINFTMMHAWSVQSLNYHIYSHMDYFSELFIFYTSRPKGNEQYCVNATFKCIPLIWNVGILICVLVTFVTGGLIDDELSTWWRHQMETFSALLALCEGNPPVTGEFPSQRALTRSFDVSLICNSQRVEQTIETPVI